MAQEVADLMSENGALREALLQMTLAFRPFTLKPIGAPGSQARADQDAQIATHAAAMKLVGRA